MEEGKEKEQFGGGKRKGRIREKREREGHKRR